jgi:hypothetical protein
VGKLLSTSVLNRVVYIVTIQVYRLEMLEALGTSGCKVMRSFDVIIQAVQY